MRCRTSCVTLYLPRDFYFYPTNKAKTSIGKIYDPSKFIRAFGRKYVRFQFPVRMSPSFKKTLPQEESTRLAMTKVTFT